MADGRQATPHATVGDASPTVPDSATALRLAQAIVAGRRSSPQPDLSTRRLLLAAPGFAHLEDLIALDADPRVSGQLLDAAVATREQALAMVVVASWHAQRHPGLGIWIAQARDGGFIGSFSLMPTAPGGEVEIGARLRPDAWGRFYAVEGGRALVEHGLQTLGLQRIVGLIHPANRAASAVLRRLGFRPDGDCMHLGQPAQRHLLTRAAHAARPRHPTHPAGV